MKNLIGQKAANAIISTPARIYGSVKTVFGATLTAAEVCSTALAAGCVVAIGGGIKGIGGVIKNTGEKIESIHPVASLIGRPVALTGKLIQKTGTPLYDKAIPVMLHPIKTAEIAKDGIRMIKEGSIYNSNPEQPMQELYNRLEKKIDKVTDVLENPLRKNVKKEVEETLNTDPHNSNVKTHTQSTNHITYDSDSIPTLVLTPTPNNKKPHFNSRQSGVRY